ncbi:heavy metal translocating P-type ATPase [Candidatus Neptunochlamydia vexilliferae]|uniref:heavy metal translocating P-type ATPase n=1 Tax=Candidatus Neptunichlamydia vexilliferae TaxID=1651774 RepID=UPI001890F3E5|nr:heavy metal translocating P-type ATPase [Candidatus Neptunochlamydia vexilliferae]
MSIVFKVAGLDCAEEISILKKALAKREGISDLAFDVLNAKMTVTCDPDKVTSDQISQWVKEAGMEAILWSEREKLEKEGFWLKSGRLVTTALSGLLLAVAIFLHIQGDKTSDWIYLAAMVFGAYFVVPKALLAIKRLQPDMNLLMIIAMIGAVFIDQWLEGATVAFLFSVALLLEHWSVGRARRAVSALMDLSPRAAHVIGEGERPAQEVKVGARILVRPGEKVPLDGVVEKGSTSINQAPITGESVPIPKEEGDTVYAGTINEEGAIECLVTKDPNDTTLARIIHLVEEAQSRRAGSQQWVEKFAKIYTPIMIGIAILTTLVPALLFGGEWATWFYRALVILVIACPCALVISTPVSIVSGLTAAARAGVLIKGGMFLEMPGKLRALALDKTGTLTYGRPEVQKVIPLNNHTEEELLERAAALEAPSEHPLARAILKYAAEKGIKPDRAEDFQITKGKGAQGTFKGTRYWIGSHRFMHEMNQETPEIHQMALELEDAGHSIIAIGNDKHICGLISVADEPRKEIAATIQEIKKAGVEEVAMLTGDNKPAAEAIARLTGVDATQAELLPEDKVKAVEALKEKWTTVAMIGDGVNDAPAMAAANFGIAMGAMGTDAAIEAADIALMADDLSKVPWLIRHSRRTLRIIQQNITFALALKAVFLALAVAGLASLWMAIAADTGASLLVVFNGLRLLKK